MIVKYNDNQATRDKYPVIIEMDNGWKIVSTIDPKLIPLAFHHDFHDEPGNWGLVDDKWNVIIEPKYLFPLYPYNDYFMVCAGNRWTQDEEWDKRNDKFPQNKGNYWSKKQLWGLIDIDENEIIPIIYDEMTCLNLGWNDHAGFDKEKSNNIFAVYRHQYPPYEMQEVAVINHKNEFLIPFGLYTDVDYFIEDNQLAVYEKGARWDDDNSKLGVYDFELKKELINPNDNYKSLEIIRRNIFLVSSDSQSGYFATIINEKEEIIGENNVWESVFNNRDDSSNKQFEFEGTLMTGEKKLFNIKDNKIIY